MVVDRPTGVRVGPDNDIVYPHVSAHMSDSDDADAYAMKRSPTEITETSHLGTGGVFLALLTITIGLIQLVGLSIVCGDGTSIYVEFARVNLYGMTLISGFMSYMFTCNHGHVYACNHGPKFLSCNSLHFITAITALRVTITRRRSTLHRFLFCYVVTTAFYTVDVGLAIDAMVTIPFGSVDGCIALVHGIGTGVVFTSFVNVVVTTLFISQTTNYSLLNCLRCCYSLWFRRVRSDSQGDVQEPQSYAVLD